jgi:ABC-type antimicrobial peptide transport system permease subunit
MLYHYIKVAFRNIWKYKVQNLTGIIGLAVGLTVFSICGYIVQFALNLDTQYAGAKQMRRVFTEDYQTVRGNVFNLKNVVGVEKMTASQGFGWRGNMTLTSQGKEILVNADLKEVDTSFMGFFGLQLTEGNMQIALNTPNSIILFESFARKWGEPRSFIGTDIVLDDTHYQLTGIMKDLPKNTSILQTKGIIMNRIGSKKFTLEATQWNPWNEYSVYILLDKRTTQEEVQKRLDNLGFTFVRDAKSRVTVEALNSSTKDKRSLINFGIILTIGLFVLLVALFNYISFQTAKFYNRLNECAIRKVSGATWIQQFWLFYIEIATVFIFSCFAGLFLVEIVSWLQLEGIDMLQDLPVAGVRLQLLRYTVTGLVLAAILCIIPVNIINRMSYRMIVMGFSSKGRTRRFRNVLMFVQMIILLVFLASAMIIRIQKDTVREHIFTSFPKEEQQRTIVASFYHKQLTDNYDVITTRVKASPAVEDIVEANYPLTTYGSLMTLNIGLEGHDKESVRQYPVSPNFLDFFNVRMVQGSFLTKDSDPNDVVVDEMFAAMFPDKNPVGASFGKFRIIGVIEDVQHIKEITSNHVEKKRPVFYSKSKVGSSMWYLKAVAGREKDAEQHFLKCVREFLPETIEFNTPRKFTEVVFDIFNIENNLYTLSSIFTVVCLILSLLSIYSAISMNTEKRRREVAIRKINGATVGDIIRLFCKTYLILWSIVCVIVFPVIYIFAKRWVETFRQQMSLDAGLFLLIYCAVLLLIGLTIIFKILKVARINPSEAISK